MFYIIQQSLVDKNTENSKSSEVIRFFSICICIKKNAILKQKKTANLKFVPSISKEKGQTSAKHNAKLFKKKLTLLEVDIKEHMIWVFWIKPKNTVNIL